MTNERELLVDFHDLRAYLGKARDSDLRRESLDRTLDAYLRRLVKDPPTPRDEPAQERLMRCLHVHAKRSAEFEQQVVSLRATVKHLEDRLEEAAAPRQTVTITVDTAAEPKTSGSVGELRVTQQQLLALKEFGLVSMSLEALQSGSAALFRSRTDSGILKRFLDIIG